MFEGIFEKFEWRPFEIVEHFEEFEMFSDESVPLFEHIGELRV